MILFYFSLVAFVMFIVSWKISGILIMKSEVATRKKLASVVLLGIIELAMVFMVFSKYNYRLNDLKIGNIAVPKIISYSRYNNDSEKDVNGLGEMNKNLAVLKRAEVFNDSNKIKEIVKIISNKKCKEIRGIRKYKLYKKNMSLPSYEIYRFDESSVKNDDVSFDGMKILGDKTIIFKTSDILSGDGKIEKRGRYVKEYAVDLSNEDRNKIIDIIVKNKQ